MVAFFAVTNKTITFVKKQYIMKQITEENFDALYIDPIEEQRIDKFVCDEMSRQMHRYIKGMSGSKEIMLKFEEQLCKLTIPEKEKALAKYISLNRKSVEDLDFKIVLARAMANFCDTFVYFQILLADDRKQEYYLERIRQKYIQFHTIYEVDGKFGIKAHDGSVLVPAEYDFLRTPYVYVDDLVMLPVIAEKNGKMGLIWPDGKATPVVDFIYDDISLKDEAPYFVGKRGKKTEDIIF